MKNNRLASQIAKIVVIVIFCSIILLPLILINTKKDAVSEIDNRNLAESPFTKTDGTFNDNLNDYLNDRIGFREEMITANIILDDRIFGLMSHPNYTYGKNGHLFGNYTISTDIAYSDFHKAFAKMVKTIQNFCEERNVPFVFTFSPSKSSVYQEFLPEWIKHDRSWVNEFFAELDRLDVNYVDNTLEMINQKNAGNKVYNFKYDVNHWNWLGSYYGTKNILENLQTSLSNIQVTPLDQMVSTLEIYNYLPNSKFPISESSYKITPPQSNLTVTDLTPLYKDEIELHPSYTAFGYYANESAKVKGAPKALIFQGSYLNSYSIEFFQNAFSEYIAVQDYQNVLRFPYYYNIFRPDCVIFEVAEYMFRPNAFNYANMSTFAVNPLLDQLTEQDRSKLVTFTDFNVEVGQTLTKVTWQAQKNLKYAWLIAGDEYDMVRNGDLYELAIPTAVYQTNKENIKVIALKK